MHKQAIKALEDKVISLHEGGRIYCDHDETEEVAFALVNAIRGRSSEDMIRSELRTAMRLLHRQGWLHGSHKNDPSEEIADVVIAEMRKL